MKNLHLIATDKPSFGKYLVINKKGELCIWSTDTMGSQITLNPQHIYITSDEEIKEGVDQWYLDKVLNEPYNSGGAQYSSKQNVIILTTDQDLIKDGVQSIDDEFLEWFVKNPSCDYVNVYDGLFGEDRIWKKQIIIPKEEQKELRRKLFTLIKSLEQEEPKEEPTQESVFENAKSSLKKYLFDNKEKVAIDLEQMREWSNTNKQDPLEEAAKEYSERHLDVSGNLGKYLVKAVFQDGGKWEQEQDKNKYSEEEVSGLVCNIIGEYGKHYGIMIDGAKLNELFEQFKKK